MICSREHTCRENEKTELISYFIFPAEQLHTPGVHICPDISFAYTVKKSVDFTVKYLASGCQFFNRYFYGRLP